MKLPIWNTKGTNPLLRLVHECNSKLKGNNLSCDSTTLTMIDLSFMRKKGDWNCNFFLICTSKVYYYKCEVKIRLLFGRVSFVHCFR